MSATVEAKEIFIRGESGAIFRMALPLHEAMAEKLHKGHIRQVSESGDALNPKDDAAVPGLPTEAPAVTAIKSEWVGWAVACGSTPDDAESLTKADLIELYRSGEPVDTKDVAEKFFKSPFQI